MTPPLPRFLLTAFAALSVLFTATAQVRPPSTTIVGYSPGLTKVEGDQPLCTTINLALTSPSNLPAGRPVTITPQIILLSAPVGVTVSEALSFVTLTPTSLTFTGPNQTLTTIVEGNFPAGIVAGDYSYQIKTPGWGVDTQDQGAFLNATIYPLPSLAGPPTVKIATPADSSNYNYEPAVGPLLIPFRFTSSAPSTAPIQAIDADLNGSSLALTTTRNSDGSLTSTGTLTITAPGIYTARARASNTEGTSSDDTTFNVALIAAPPQAAINSPTSGSIFTLSSSGNVSVPYAFSGRSYFGGITALTATLNGQPVTFSPSGLTTLTAAGSGNFVISTAGDYELVVTATDQNGTSAARTSFSVRAPVYTAPPSVSIAAPLNGATYTRVAGSSPTPITFSFTGDAGAGSALTGLSGTLNGAPLTAMISGLGTQTATAGGTLLVSAAGTYTLSAIATSAAGTASTSLTFKVSETINSTGFPPPAAGCSVNWLPPISLGRTQKGGQTVAVKFELDCGCEKGTDRTGDGDPDSFPGQRTKSKTRIDKTIVIAISQVFANGNSSTPKLFTSGQYTIQGNDMYHLNFPTLAGAHRYRIEIVSLAKSTPQVLATREFLTR